METTGISLQELAGRRWDIQWGANECAALGVHFEHRDPSLTLHLPGLFISLGRCWQPGFAHSLRRWLLRRRRTKHQGGTGATLVMEKKER